MAFISTPLGLIVGVILALTGSGGGILAIPWLMFGPGLSVAQAGPIGLLAVGIGAVLGAVLGLRAATIRYKAALLMAPSPFGLRLASRLDKHISSVLFSVRPFHLETQLCARAGTGWSLVRLLGAGGGFVMVPALRRYTDLTIPSTIRLHWRSSRWCP